MLIDITAEKCCLESGLANNEVAQIFLTHPTFSVHIDEDVAAFSDNGRIFFACSYNHFYRNGEYIRIDDPITINLCVPIENIISNRSTLRPFMETIRSWKDETPVK